MAIAERLGEATKVAEGRGHTLAGFRFKYQQGTTGCVKDGCGCVGLVNLLAPYKLVGSVFHLDCRAGNSELVKPPTVPAPTTGASKPLPVAPRPTSPVWDDAPFPMDAPVRDTMVTR